MLDELREKLLSIPEIREFSEGNIYTHYLNDQSIFPCITLFYIEIVENETSIQIKLWSLEDKGVKANLLNTHKVLITNFDLEEKKNIEVQKIFQGQSIPEIDVKETSLVEAVERREEDDIILEEEINGIKIFSLPTIFSVQDLSPTPDQIEPVSV